MLLCREVKPVGAFIQRSWLCSRSRIVELRNLATVNNDARWRRMSRKRKVEEEEKREKEKREEKAKNEGAKIKNDASSCIANGQHCAKRRSRSLYGNPFNKLRRQKNNHYDTRGRELVLNGQEFVTSQE